jgi:hypothetical protein
MMTPFAQAKVLTVIEKKEASRLREKAQLEECRIQYTEDRMAEKPDINNLTMSET